MRLYNISFSELIENIINDIKFVYHNEDVLVNVYAKGGDMQTYKEWSSNQARKDWKESFGTEKDVSWEAWLRYVLQIAGQQLFIACINAKHGVDLVRALEKFEKIVPLNPKHRQVLTCVMNYYAWDKDLAAVK